MKKVLTLVLVSMLMVSAFSLALADTHGLAMVTTFGAVKNAEVKDGETYEGAAPVDSIACSVVLDDNGVIKSVRFDTVQPRVKFTVEGKLVEADYTSPIASKIDLGDAYGMKKASGIEKEWFEQIAAFEEFCAGKTVEQVQTLTAEGAPEADTADLKANVTISLGNYVAALVKAASLAK